MRKSHHRLQIIHHRTSIARVRAKRKSPSIQTKSARSTHRSMIVTKAMMVLRKAIVKNPKSIRATQIVTKNRHRIHPNTKSHPTPNARIRHFINHLHLENTKWTRLPHPHPHPHHTKTATIADGRRNRKVRQPTMVTVDSKSIIRWAQVLATHWACWNQLHRRHQSITRHRNRAHRNRQARVAKRPAKRHLIQRRR